MTYSQPKTYLESLQQATAATIRAIAEKKELDVVFVSESLTTPMLQTEIPVPHDFSTAEALQNMRGYSDELALRQKHHDESLHSQLRPTSSIAQKVFDLAENARFAALGGKNMLGVASNLNQQLELHCRKITQTPDFCAADDMFSIAVGLHIRQRLCQLELPPTAKKIFSSWQDNMGNLDEKIEPLTELLTNQKAFAIQIRTLISEMGLLDESALPPPDTEEIADLEDSDEQNDSNDQTVEDDMPADENNKGSDGTDKEMAHTGVEGNPKVAPASDQDSTDVAGVPLDASKNIGDDSHYHAYTTKFDSTVRVKSLCSSEEMTRLRAILDEKLTPLKHNVSRLANKLRRHLMAKKTMSWEFGLESGILDTSRLAGIVANPNHRLAYKWEKETNFHDTVVTLLIDCSGSMRGHSITMAAMCADILGNTLEHCAVKVEILGFTTSAWRGGQARSKWLAAGKPKNPGRLNDVLHKIYKSADEPWAQARKNLGLLMNEDILKENIDGEALLWAHSRLIMRKEQRRILMIISDGLPVDNSTLLANQPKYLETHLNYTVDLIENHSPIELVAIGIGHDVTRHYKRAITILRPEHLAQAMVDQLVYLFNVKDKPKR